MSTESANDAPGSMVDDPTPSDFASWEVHPYTIALRQSAEAKLQQTAAPLAEAKAQIDKLSAALVQTVQERDATRRALDQHMRIAVQLSERVTELQERIRGQA